MASKVFFTKDLTKAAELFDAAGFDKIIAKDCSVALKIHFGEPGNKAYIKPYRIKPIAEKIISLGGKPFYTDCNTLYSGPRKETKTHQLVSLDHGYSKESAGCESIIPEENDFSEVEVNLKHFKKVFIGNNAVKSDAIIALTHFKGHEVTGFGGALKNLGMGFAPRVGKLKQHSDCKNCEAKPTCKKKETISSCFVAKPKVVMEKMVEYAYGAVKDKKAAYINFVCDVSENCDCYDYNSEPIVPDIGILASFDPVAVDQACVDLVNKTSGRIKSGNKFRALWTNIDWSIQLKYAEEIGMGTREYELIQV